MRPIITTFCATMLATGGLTWAEIIPVWSTGVAVPGEQVVLYLVETQEDGKEQDIFMVKKLPTVQDATVQVQQPKAGANPLDPDRKPVEIQPIVFKADRAGRIAPDPIEVEYNSGARSTISIPPLPVRPTSDIKWFSEPVTYGALWYTSVEDGYVHQPVQTSLKLFMPGDCATPYAPQFNSVGTKVSNFRPAVEGIVGQIHGSLVSEPLAYAKGQTWRTADFNGSYTPFREGKNDIVGKIVMVRQRGFFSIGQQEVPLPTLEVSALPLPPGAPADFADTVGVYTISATTTAKSLAMNEAVEVEITVRGSGNLEQLACPKPEDELNWRLVPATRKPILGANGETIGMVFSQLMRPTAEVSGLPSFGFSYFDPEEMAYRTAATKPIPMEWRETDDAGSGLVTAPAAEPPPAGSVPVAELTDIYHFMPNAEAGGNAAESLQLPRWTWYLLYVPGLAIFVWLAIRALLRRIAAGAGSRAREKELSAIAAAADGLSFLKGIGAFIESRIPPAEQSSALQAILQRRDAEAFTPGAAPVVSSDERQRMLRTVRKALSKLAPALMLLLCLLPQAQAAGDAAEQAYTAGQYSKALELLENEQKNNTGNRDSAERLYNMGNCCYRLGKSGQAALYYARALYIDPSLAEAEANLGFIQRKEGAIVPRATGVDKAFTLLNCRQLWLASIICSAAFLFCLALLALRRGQKKPWLQACTATTALLCLLCAADWLYYATRSTPDMSGLPAADFAMVTTTTTARTAATADAPSVVELPASTPLHLLAVRGSFSYVETFTGVRGWVRTEDVSPLADSATPKRTPITIRFQ